MTEPTLSDEQLYKLARDAGATCKMFGTLPDGTNRFNGIECTTAQLRSIIAADRQVRQDATVVYKCPRCGTEMQPDLTAKPARQAPEGDRDEALRLAREAGLLNGSNAFTGVDGMESRLKRLIALARASASPQEPVAWQNKFNPYNVIPAKRIFINGIEGTGLSLEGLLAAGNKEIAEEYTIPLYAAAPDALDARRILDLLREAKEVIIRAVKDESFPYAEFENRIDAALASEPHKER